MPEISSDDCCLLFDRFTVALVAGRTELRGVWHNRFDGTWERVREGQPGAYASNRAGSRMGEVPWIPEGVFIDDEEMQAVSDLGLATTL